MYRTKEEVEVWLIEMDIKNYVINENLTVDVSEEVNISSCELSDIPVQFGVINGNFYCYNNKLTSLKGCPREIKGSFFCNDNKLKNLENCPEVIKGGFYCSINNLTSLENCPREVNGEFNCSDNKLSNLKNCPQYVKGSFYCHNNKLTSLEGCQEVINGHFNCGENELKSLYGCPLIISGNFSCYDNNLTSLEYFPKEINGDGVHIFENNIKEEELVNFNCKIGNVETIDSDFNEDGNIEEFLEKVNYYKSKRENELLKELSVNSNNVKLNKKL